MASRGGVKQPENREKVSGETEKPANREKLGKGAGWEKVPHWACDKFVGGF